MTAALLGALFAYPPAELCADDTLPPPVIRAPQEAPQRAPEAKPKPKPKPEADPIVYEERGPWSAPSSSSADPQWASSIMGPRRWAPAPPPPRPRWSPPLEQPVPEVVEVVEPKAAPLPTVVPPEPTPPAAEKTATPIRRPTGLPDWSAAADPSAIEARRRDDAKLIHPLDTMPPAADPYWASTITAPVPTTRVEVGPIRRTPGWGIVPARPRSGPVGDNRVPPPAYETGGRDRAGPRVPPIPPPPPPRTP